MLFGLRKIFLFLTVLSCCSAIQVSIEKEEYEAEKGGEITLTCTFIPARAFNTMVLSWEAAPDEAGEPMKSVATYFTNNPIDISPAYENRAFVEVDPDRRVSTLRLIGLTMQDSRQFQCSVKIPNDDEGTPAATTFLLVLVPPSKPVCKIQGTAEYGHNISLTCISEEGSPQPAYKWSSYSVDNIPRNFPPRTTEKDGVLSLFNVSKEMSGFYICLSKNRIGSASCNLTLSVMPGSMNLGSTAVIIGGAVAGVVVLGIVVYCCCCRKGKNEEPAEGSPEEMTPLDKDAAEAKQHRDDKSKDEDKDVAPKSNYSVGAAGQRPEDDRHSDYSGKGRHDGKGSDVDSQRYQDDRRDQYRGSRDQLNDQRDTYRGSRDRLNDQDTYRGSRDRLNDQDTYRGSRDRLNDQDTYRGSRDRLNDQDTYRGSRDRLNDQDTYRGSRDRLNDQDTYRGSRDRLNERQDHYRRSQDRLDDQRDTYRGSKDRLDDRRDQYRGSRDRLDDRRDRYGGSRDHIDYIDDR